MSTIFDALTRRRHSHRPPRGRPNAAHDIVLASLGFRPRRRLGKPAKVMLILLAGVAVIATWTGWGLMSRGTRANELAPPRSTPAPVSQQAPRTEPPAQQSPAVAADTSAERRAIEPDPNLAPPSTPLTSEPSASKPAPEPLNAVKIEAPTPALESPIRALSTAPAPVASPRAASSPAAPPLPKSSPAAPSRSADPRAPTREAPREAEAPATMSQALYYHRAGDFDKALAAYRSVLQQNELNAAVHNNLGLLYQERGMLDAAAAAFQRAIILDERYALAFSNYGVTLLRQGRSAAAAAQFRRALEIEPRNADVLVNLALAAQASGDRPEARSALLRALAESPAHALAHYNLAVLEDEAGDASRAVVHYRAYLDHAGTADPDRAAQVRARLTALGGT